MTFCENIKGILFDMDGTLYSQRPLRIIMALLIIVSNLHQPNKLVKILRVVFYYRKSQEILRKEHQGNNNRKNQIQITSEKTGESIHYISSVVDVWFEKKPIYYLRFCVKRGLHQALRIWHEKGITLGIYSDYPAENKSNALGITQYMKTIVSSSDADVSGFKPHTNGFLVAAKKMGLKPCEILYVGDRSEVDGVGASEAGMQVVILKNTFEKKTNEYIFCNSFKKLIHMTT